jgi:hypothetical protein
MHSFPTAAAAAVLVLWGWIERDESITKAFVRDKKREQEEETSVFNAI